MEFKVLDLTDRWVSDFSPNFPSTNELRITYFEPIPSQSPPPRLRVARAPPRYPDRNSGRPKLERGKKERWGIGKKGRG